MENIKDAQKNLVEENFNSPYPTFIDNNFDIYTEEDSVCTKDFKPFRVKLELIRKIKTREILKREVEKDQTLLILKVRYDTSDNNEMNNKNKSSITDKYNLDINDDLTFDWEIYKTYKEIRNLIFILNLNLENNIKNYINLKREVIVKLNILSRMEMNELKKNMKIIIDLINELLKIPKIRDKIFFLEFLEISRHSFDCFNDGNKPKEGYILKQNLSKKNRSFLKCLCCLFCCCNRWQNRWFVLKDDMICYLDNSSSNIGKDVFWFDQELIIIKDYKNNKNSLGLINLGRSLVLKFKDEYEREIWYEILLKKVTDYQTKGKNIYDSFANEKSLCNAKWFVEAHDYFSDLYDKLMSAKESIYIAGWWISPEIHLKRPARVMKKSKDMLFEERTRLMDVLKIKAEEGVQVNILVYKEVKLALSMNSNHTKNIFNNLHPNVKVTRHPKNNLDLLWSHHEKIIIIDQNIGYVGGIDLCWGRYDTHEHLLNEEVNEDEVYHWPGIDYSNNRLMDFQNVNLPHIDGVNRANCARMPWHDISVYLEGPVISDLCRHFVERWNFARTITTTFTQNKKFTIINVKSQNKRSYSKSSYRSAIKSETNSGLTTPLMQDEINSNYHGNNIIKTVYKIEKIDENVTENSFESISDREISYNRKSTIHYKNNKIGLVDSQNNFKNENTKLNDNHSDIETKKLSRRMTGTEINIKRPKKSEIKTNRNINQNSNHSNICNNNQDDNSRPTLLNKIKSTFINFTDKIKTKSTNMKDKIINKFFNKNFKDLLKDEDLINIKINDGNLEKTENRTCQILRSASEWSVGLDNKTENSILKAYYNLIDNSKHYILIENQFFMSKSFTDDENLIAGSQSSSILNEIALHLRRRIEKAYENKEKFRVFIFIPLLPAFPGEVTDTSTLQIILKYTYRTISRNKGLSLIEKLYQLMQDGYEDYIHFFSLRTHGNVNNIPKTELIYIHSKMMIVDDEVTLIGSANINDRSMLGRRDSEVAVIIKDEDKITTKMNGVSYSASSFAHSLRVRLFKEHLGFDINSNLFPEILLDPLDDKLFKMMKQVAKSNSFYFSEIFNCYPDDKFERFVDVSNRTEDEVETLRGKYYCLKDKILGNIVDFPLDFLKGENLNRSYFSREILVPIKNFL